MQGEEQSGYSKCAYSFIDQRLLAIVGANLAMWDKFVDNYLQ